jgi:hypothetical protein
LSDNDVGTAASQAGSNLRVAIFFDCEILVDVNIFPPIAQFRIRAADA